MNYIYPKGARTVQGSGIEITEKHKENYLSGISGPLRSTLYLHSILQPRSQYHESIAKIISTFSIINSKIWYRSSTQHTTKTKYSAHSL